MYLLHHRGQGLRYSPRRGNPHLWVVALYMEKASKREPWCLLGSWRLSVTFPTTHKQIGPFWCLFQGGWVCVHSRTWWVSPTNSPVRLRVSPNTTTSGVYSQRFWVFISPHCNPGFCVLAPQLFPPVYPHANVGLLPSSSCSLACLFLQLPTCHMSSLPQLPIPTPPSGLDECFFLNSLLLWIPYSSIFWQFGCFFGLKFVVVLLLIVQGGKVCLPRASSWPELKFIS